MNSDQSEPDPKRLKRSKSFSPDGEGKVSSSSESGAQSSTSINVESDQSGSSSSESEGLLQSPDREDEVSSSVSERRDEHGAQVIPAGDGDLLRIQRLAEVYLLMREIALKHASDALYWSARAGDLSQCESLLARGANVNHVEDVEYNDTPLHTASLNGRTSVVKLLIDRGAEIEAKDWIGCTPLHCAAQEGHLATARLLVTRGARTATGAAIVQGVMPIHTAATTNRHQVLYKY